jgi:hypothetical protein
MEGRKRQTRRIITAKRIAAATCATDCSGPQPGQAWPDPGIGDGGYLRVPCADGASQRVRYSASVGDRLWVRETWRTYERPGQDVGGVYYVADGTTRLIDGASKSAAPWIDSHDDGKHGVRWRPSIFMPRWASRITLEVTGVRVERLQDISSSDARAEGVRCPEHDFPGGFCHGPCEALGREWVRLWNSINGKRAAWATNPWVFVVSFSIVQP